MLFFSEFFLNISNIQ